MTLTDKSFEKLDITCNKNKCQYSRLRKMVEASPDCQMTSIFISIDSILREFCMKLHEKNIKVESEKIAQSLLSIAGHYKNFFKKYDRNCNQICIFFYNDMYYQYDLFKNSCVSKFKDSHCEHVLTDIDIIFSKICKFIPYVYYINTGKIGLPGSLIPMQLIKGIKNSAPLLRSRYIIVSTNGYDYTSAFLGNDMHKVFVFRRGIKDKFITVDNIYEDFVFRNSKRYSTPKYAFNNSLFFYPRIVFSKRNIYRLRVLPDMYNEYRDKIFHYVFNDNANHNEAERKLLAFEARNTGIKELLKVVNAPELYVQNISALETEKRLWKSDCIDFTIEQLNYTFFRKYPVNFNQLF